MTIFRRMFPMGESNGNPLFDDSFPVLPYAGTSGFSGSATSEERARREDSDGTTTQRQLAAINYLKWRGVGGGTWREFAEYADLHHGQASGVLSVLHKSGRIVRLKERRNRCAVYVTADNTAGRDVDEYRQTITRTQIREHLATLEELLDERRYQTARMFVDALRQELG